MLTVTQLARQAGVTVDTVRHYARIGLLQSERNPRNGYRLFDREDIQRLRFIRQAQGLGFTLTNIGQILDDARRGISPCPQVRKIIAWRIEENREKLRQLNALQQRMEHALKKWQDMPDYAPGDGSICALIESVQTEA